MSRRMPGMKFAAGVFYDDVTMAGPQTEGVNLESSLVPGFAQRPEDEFAIEVVVEDDFATIAAVHDRDTGPTAVVHGRLVEPIR